MSGDRESNRFNVVIKDPKVCFTFSWLSLSFQKIVYRTIYLIVFHYFNKLVNLFIEGSPELWGKSKLLVVQGEWTPIFLSPDER